MFTRGGVRTLGPERWVDLDIAGACTRATCPLRDVLLFLALDFAMTATVRVKETIVISSYGECGVYWILPPQQDCTSWSTPSAGLSRAVSRHLWFPNLALKFCVHGYPLHSFGPLSLHNPIAAS